MFKNYTFASFPPVKEENNNRILNAPHSMPFKGANSSGDSTFSSGRAVYMKSLDLSLYNVAPSSNKQSLIWKKKFYGGTNRDASSIIEKKKTNTIGLATMNENGKEISFS